MVLSAPTTPASILLGKHASHPVYLHQTLIIHSVGHDTTTKKPSLLDRINPMKDTDGDGKKGIMD